MSRRRGDGHEDDVPEPHEPATNDPATRQTATHDPATRQTATHDPATPHELASARRSKRRVATDGGQETYATVESRSAASFTVQGSEFIGHIAPVGTQADADAFVEEIAAEYDDATHNVPAYRVRVESSGPGGGFMLREYSSDDGEPSGSAGKPMLNVLQGQDLQNVAVVVTRYYGGTNLGVGGLVRAYSRAVSDAIDAATVIEERPSERFSVTVDYDDSGTVRGILESATCEFDADYDETVAFDVDAPIAEADALRDRIRSATSGRAAID